jgi:folate-binding protein YgfZ
MFTTAVSDKEFIRLSGPDTISFLQGQVSCDMAKLSADNSLTGALCNLKGRVIADFRLLLDGDDCLLQTSQGMADKILTVLGKYAVFSKVELRRDEAVKAVVGIFGEDSEAQLASLGFSVPQQINGCASLQKNWLIRLPGSTARFELWCQADNPLADLHKPTGTYSQHWQREDILQGIVHVTAESSGQYTPQLLNYDISGLINFKKGCYTGQEVVARMYYRSKAKKRMFLLSSDRPIAPDSKLLAGDADDGSDKPYEILAFANGEDGEDRPNVLLAILDTSLQEQGKEIRLQDEPGAVLKFEPLPYQQSAAVNTN